MLFRVTYGNDERFKLFNLANVAWMEHTIEAEVNSEGDREITHQLLDVQFVNSNKVERFLIDDDTAQRFTDIWNETR